MCACACNLSTSYSSLTAAVLKCSKFDTESTEEEYAVLVCWYIVYNAVNPG